MTKLEAKPGAIDVDLTNAAVVVVDTQNAFASKGGMLDIAGADISDAPRVVRSIKGVLDAARLAGVLVVYVHGRICDTALPRCVSATARALPCLLKIEVEGAVSCYL